jgi:ATP-binding cassette, subfamily B, bacterial
MVLFWNYLRKYKNVLILTLVLATINQVFSLLDPQIIRILLDNYASKINELDWNTFLQGVLWLLAAYVGVSLISRIAKNFQDYYVNVITQSVGTDMYAGGVEHTFSLPYSVFEDQRSGELLQKLQKARIDFQKLIENFIGTIYLSGIGLLFAIIYAFTVHWIIGITYFSLIPVVGLFAFLISRRIKDAQKKIVIESAELAGSTTETIRNVELVKSLGLEKEEIERLNSVNINILDLEIKKIKVIKILSFLQGTLLNGLRAILMLVMFWLIFKGQISIGEFFTLLVYSFFVFTPLAQLGELASTYQEAKASSEELNEILKLKPEKKPKNPLKIGNKIESIKFKQVNFSYLNSRSASIKNINLDILPGKSYAFVGPSGSGKTTLVKLLLGLYQPKKGKVLINNIENTKIDYDAFRKKIGLVSQETQLFAGTVRENLLFANKKANDEDCLKVLEIVSLMKILNKGKKALDTKIGENGIKLSGGEKQRLAIARALIRNPEMLIFDEATSSLDSLTESQVSKTIENIINANKKMIVISIAHRLSTIFKSDEINVLEKGKIIERGTHKELLDKKGLYQALWREQSGESDPTKDF